MFTMSYNSPVNPVPFISRSPSGTTQLPSSFSRHGSLEQPVGGWQSVSQPQTPRSARALSERRDRSRDRRDRSPRRSDDDDREPSQGWGPRIISLEQKVIDLQSQINGADVRITARFVGAEGRLNAIDTAMPQRFANIEQRQIEFMNTMNALSAALGSKIEQIEQLLLAQAVGPHTPPTMPVPQVPQSFGGQAAPSTAQHFHVGSPLSAPPPGIQPNTPDPWAEYSAGRPQVNQQPRPSVSPTQIGSSRLAMKPWDVKEWSIAHAKVSK